MQNIVLEFCIVDFALLDLLKLLISSLLLFYFVIH